MEHRIVRPFGGDTGGVCTRCGLPESTAQPCLDSDFDPEPMDRYADSGSRDQGDDAVFIEA